MTISTNDAWMRFRKSEIEDASIKDVSLQGKLDTIAAQLNKIEVDTSRVADTVPDLLADSELESALEKEELPELPEENVASDEDPEGVLTEDEGVPEVEKGEEESEPATEEVKEVSEKDVEAPVEKPVEKPEVAEAPAEKPEAVAEEKPVETPVETVEKPAEAPAEKSEDAPVEAEPEAVAEKPAEAPAPAETVEEKPEVAETPAEKPAESDEEKVEKEAGAVTAGSEGAVNAEFGGVEDEKDDEEKDDEEKDGGKVVLNFGKSLGTVAKSMNAILKALDELIEEAEEKGDEETVEEIEDIAVKAIALSETVVEPLAGLAGELDENADDGIDGDADELLKDEDVDENAVEVESDEIDADEMSDIKKYGVGPSQKRKDGQPGHTGDGQGGGGDGNGMSYNGGECADGREIKADTYRKKHGWTGDGRRKKQGWDDRRREKENAQKRAKRARESGRSTSAYSDTLGRTKQRTRHAVTGYYAGSRDKHYVRGKDRTAGEKTISSYNKKKKAKKSYMEYIASAGAVRKSATPEATETTRAVKHIRTMDEVTVNVRPPVKSTGNGDILRPTSETSFRKSAEPAVWGRDAKSVTASDWAEYHASKRRMD